MGGMGNVNGTAVCANKASGADGGSDGMESEDAGNMGDNVNISNEELNARIDAYLESNWENMVGDIADLVHIPSVLEEEKAAPNAPFGPGPRESLSAALGMAQRMGFATRDVDGYIGYADFPGESETQVAIIGHTDVVPAGPGWTFEPFQVTRREGYLIGRGVIDDKGPTVVALHAVKFWKDLQDAGLASAFPYTVRFLFGANEETGMHDVEYYQERYADPAFLFTPDAEFPVSYGEKGGYDGLIRSKQIPAADRVVVSFEGGTVTNAVPGFAEAVVRANAADLPKAESIAISEEALGLARLVATGKSAHASTPEEGVSAIGLIADYLLANDLCSPGERAYFELVQQLIHHTDGGGVGIASADEHFGPLTVVGGTMRMEGDCFVQSMDVRYPTSIAADEITARMSELAEKAGGVFENTKVTVPFLVDPESPVIQALLNAYNEATGEDAKPFTMGGGTYARHFKTAASFGLEKPWEEVPAWVGGMHGPDEGVSEDLLKQAFRIYALTLGKLMALDLE